MIKLQLQKKCHTVKYNLENEKMYPTKILYQILALGDMFHL